MIKQIKKSFNEFDILTEIDKPNILTKTTSEISSEFSEKNLSIWAQRSFDEYGTIWSGIQQTYFANDENNLFTGISNGISLKTIYEEYLYKHRNRIAHNTQSYQQNLPTLKTLVNEDFKYDNYFVYFSILVLIDFIFIELYRKYLLVVEDKID